ncbi:MAG: LPXTG cell wall anchor domain-containing protein [Candidatus Saccharimonas sp.]
MKYHLVTFASTYSCNTYGAGSYNDANCQEQTSTDSSGNGVLPATGESLFIGIGAGFLLIVIAIVIIVRMRKNHSR